MSSCLVTDEIDFDYEEINYPSVLLDLSGSETPIGDIIYYDISPENTSVDDGSFTTPSPIEFELRVLDENVSQELQGRRNLSLQDLSSGEFISVDIGSVPIETSYELERFLSFEIRVGYFIEDRCYRVELAVTNEFESEDKDDLNNWDKPKAKDDIAKATWYVVTGDSVNCQWTTEYQ